jgi:putative oxidoreductase
MAPGLAPQTSADVRINTLRLITNALAWILAILLAIAFTLAGGVKLIGVPGMVQEFAQIGLGQWFRYFTGALELSGAIGLLIPRVRFWAALQIAVVMVGATFANLAVLHVPVLARVTAILLALALVLAWLRRAERHLLSVKF